MGKIKKWIKDHKKEVAYGLCATGFAVGTGVLYYHFGVKGVKSATTSKPKIDVPIEPTCIELPELGNKSVMNFFLDDNEPDLMLNDIKISDLGKVGTGLVDNIDSINEDSFN